MHCISSFEIKLQQVQSFLSLQPEWCGPVHNCQTQPLPVWPNFDWVFSNLALSKPLYHHHNYDEVKTRLCWVCFVVVIVVVVLIVVAVHKGLVVVDKSLSDTH